MCLNLMRIKSVSSSGQKFAFIPCGKCAECRKSYQSQWFFRLAAECLMAQKRGWKIAFFTLTYNDTFLPSVDGVTCFRRMDVRRLILRLRKKYHKGNDVTGLRYLIASEYGEKTKRPHYHGIICFPPDISSVQLCSDIQHFWSTDESEGLCSLGYIYPTPDFVKRDESLFLCKSAYGAAQYAAKYCCKDVAHESLISDLNLSDEQRREHCSFHIQSRSLGFELVKNMSDEEKFELYKNGLQLVGSDRSLSIPLYIRNKLFFDPRYTYDEKGNRLVERVASPFLRKYASEIFEKKVDFYELFFEKARSLDYWLSVVNSQDSVINSSIARSNVSIVEHLIWRFDGVRNLALYYVAYYGVPYFRRFSDPLWSWLQRYEECWIRDKASYKMQEDDLSITLLLSAHHLYNKEYAYEKMKDIDKILDYWNNQN